MEKTIRADWRDEDRACLLDDDDQLVARLHLEDWYREGARTSQPAWVVSWLDPAAESPTTLKTLVEFPAMTVTHDRRRQEIVAAALIAMARGPSAPMPRAAALSEPPDYASRFRQLELLINAWDEANVKLGEVLRDHGAYAAQRFIALSDVLARTYAVDRTMDVVWAKLPDDIRDDASHWADEMAERAILHNTDIRARFGDVYEPRTDVGLEAYFIRSGNSKPYPHWTGPLLSGAIQEGFFKGLRWIRGQMTYAGALDPIELWQYEPGVEPRWKWKDARAITTGLNSNVRERDLYERFLAGHDVLGLFSHLLSVFWDSKWKLRKLSKRAELRRPGLPTRT